MGTPRLRVATVILEDVEENAAAGRFDALRQIGGSLTEKYRDKPIVALFPAGWFEVPCAPTKGVLERIVGGAVPATSGGLSVVFGIDGRDGRDQLAAAVTAQGLVALGRKFHPHPTEEGWIDRATDWLGVEQGLPRIARMFGNAVYLAVCYDCFGPRHLNLPRPESVTAVLVPTHGFKPRGEEGSGQVDFARKGLAGLSDHWRLPAFASAVFRRCRCPPRWPSGIACERFFTRWRYQDNKLAPEEQLAFDTAAGPVQIRVFSLPPPG
jgi:hypothetical protein